MIGNDYQRGLRMLKEYVETGEVSSQTEVVGIVDVAQKQYVGVSDQCGMEEIAQSMQRTIPQSRQMATDGGCEIDGPPGAIYQNVDLKRQRCKYTAFWPIAEPTNRVDDGEVGTIMACKALKVVHRGPYCHLGNAWSTAMAHQRFQKLKCARSQSPFEIYVSDPNSTPSNEIVTEIYVPVKG